MRQSIIIFFIFPSLSIAGNSLCTKKETTLFSCPVVNKTVSVCASNNLSSTKGYIQYRFGKKQNIELQFPDKLEHPTKHFTQGAEAYSLGGASYLRFNVSDYKYSVYSSGGRSYGKNGEADSVRGWHDAGVIVEKYDKIISSLKCRLPKGSEGGLELPENENIIKLANIPNDNSYLRLP